MATQNNFPRLIHIGKVMLKGKTHYVFLRKVDDHRYSWFEQGSNNADNTELDTSLSASSIEEAIRIAARNWCDNSFTTLKCGFRYTLPERDEHGINALFYQMAASYNSANGVYFDEELGNNCFVNSASLEARDLIQQLKQQNRL